MAPRQKQQQQNHISPEQLLFELQQDNLFFDDVVDRIPAALYVPAANPDSYNPKYEKTPSNDSAALKQARKVKHQQAKRDKLNPTTAESTTQLKKRLDKSASSASDGVQNAMPTSKSSNSKKVSPSPSPSTKSSNNQSRIEALRAKLHAKLAEKNPNRNNKNDPTAVSKRAARRAEKRKRQEEAKQRKQQKKSARSKAAKDAKNTQYRLADANSAAAVATDLQHVDFGPLRGLNDTKAQQYQKTNKSLANLSKTKNLQKLLADAERKKEQLEVWKRQGSTADEQAQAAKVEWNDALKEAAGVKTPSDNPTKVKQQLKRMAAKKSKSQKAWKTRMEQTKSKMDERQSIRNHNLQQRKQGGSAGANLSSKRIKDKEDGGDKSNRRLSRPGFEGRKQGFLNGNGSNSKLASKASMTTSQ